MRYLLVGANGQLGRDLAPRLAGTVIPLTRADLDLARPEMIQARLTELNPDAVINCAAYNYVDRAEGEAVSTFAVNTWGVRELARACAVSQCLLVHFSTDHVFGLDAHRLTPYAESDAPGPVNVYGLSKLCGEYLVRSHCPDHLVIRTCGLYGVWGVGGKGGNFVEAILRKVEEGGPLRVVDDQVCSPSYTVDIAQAVVALLERGVRGLVHLTNAGQCSWWEFARAICRLSNLDVSVQPINSSEYGAIARRPSFSALDNAVLRERGLPSLRPWTEALADYLRERQRK